MADEPENLTLKLLREMRAEQECDRDAWGFHHTILFDRFSGDPNGICSIRSLSASQGSSSPLLLALRLLIDRHWRDRQRPLFIEGRQRH